MPSLYNGILVLSGLMIFVIAEKLFSAIGKLTEKNEEQALTEEQINNNINGYNPAGNKTKPVNKKRVGYFSIYHIFKA